MQNVALNSVGVTLLNATLHLANFAVFAGIAALFGASSLTDAFFLAFAIPSFFISAVVSGVGSVFIPLIADYRFNHPEEMGQLIGSSLILVLVFSILSAIVTGLSAPLIIRLAVSSRKFPDFATLATQQLLVLLPVIVIQIAT